MIGHDYHNQNMTKIDTAFVSEEISILPIFFLSVIGYQSRLSSNTIIQFKTPSYHSLKKKYLDVTEYTRRRNVTER